MAPPIINSVTPNKPSSRTIGTSTPASKCTKKVVKSAPEPRRSSAQAQAAAAVAAAKKLEEEEAEKLRKKAIADAYEARIRAGEGTFYLGEVADAIIHPPTARRKKYAEKPASMYEILSWGGHPAPLPPPPPPPVTAKGKEDRWVSEKMDEYDHKAKQLVLSPARRCHKTLGGVPGVIDRETLLGPEALSRLMEVEEKYASKPKGLEIAVPAGASSDLLQATSPRPVLRSPVSPSPTKKDKTAQHAARPSSSSPSTTKQTKAGASTPVRPSSSAAVRGHNKVTPAKSGATKTGGGGGAVHGKENAGTLATPVKKVSSAKKKMMTPNTIGHKPRTDTLATPPSHKRYQRLEKDKRYSRDMSNTEFGKVFKRPIFGPYGYGNVKPMMGGVVYGEYMMSHNIEPEVLPNHPRSKQTYPSAEYKAMARSPNSIKRVPFDPALNAALPPEFMKSIEKLDPAYLNAYLERTSPSRQSLRKSKEAKAAAAEEDGFVMIDYSDAAGAPPDISSCHHDDLPSPPPPLPHPAASTSKSASVPSSPPPPPPPPAPEKKVAPVKTTAEVGTTTSSEPIDKVIVARRRKVDKSTRVDISQLEVPCLPYAPPSPPSRPRHHHSQQVTSSSSFLLPSPPALPGDLKNNPKVYKLLPREWVGQIQPAGIHTVKGDSVRDCLLGSP